jgi:uncharacterized OB-fold protein
MTQLPRPIVSPSPDGAAFWDAAKRGEFKLPFCRSCRTHFFYPRSTCPHCGSRELDWVQESGRGKLYSFCIHHHTSIRELREAVPFITALVDLEEGPRMMTYLVGMEPDPALIKCGIPLEVTFIESGNEYALPVFRPS